MYFKKNFRKRFKNSALLPSILSFVISLCIICLTVGYSAFNSKLNVSDISARVSVIVDVRVTGLNIDDMTNNAISIGEDYNYDNINALIKLPNPDSTISYKVKVTNFGNVEEGIFDITGLPDNLEYEVSGFNLKTDSICEDNKCINGVDSYLIVTVKYKDDGYNADNTDYNIKMDFDFRYFHTITYDESINDYKIATNYPTKVMDGDSLDLEFLDAGSSFIRLYGSSWQLKNGQDYEYESGNIHIPEVSMNITVKYFNKAYIVANGEKTYYKEDAYRNDIQNVYFVHYINTNNAVTTYDLSENQDESIIGWLEVNANEKYDLYIGSEYDMFARETNISGMFRGMSNLLTVNFNNLLDTSEATSISYMFYNNKKLSGVDLSNFDTSNVTTLNSMFYGCEKLESIDVTNFDTSNVKNMKFMFYGCEKLESIDVTNFNTSNVTDMSSMFYKCKKIEYLNLSNFDVKKVTNMNNMFQKMQNLKSLDLSNFITSSVTNIGGLFGECFNLESLDISNFNTSKVTDFGGVFRNCSSLKSLDLSNFDTSKATKMRGMFYKCSSLETLDLSNFNTSNVTLMGGMFSGCKNLKELNISSFNTSKNTETYYYHSGENTGIGDSVKGGMFSDCTSLTNLDLSNFDLSQVTEMKYMFYGDTNLTSLDLSGTDFDQVTNYIDMFTNVNESINITVKDLDNKQWIMDKFPTFTNVYSLDENSGSED